jgi:uncharacterized protein
MSCVRYDAAAWPDKAEVTPEGFLRVDAAPITRMGVLHYTNPDGTPRGELRHPDDWGTALALSSFASLPLTNDHPPGRESDGQPLVDAKNAKRLAVGWTGETVRVDGAYLRSAVTVTDADTVAAVQRGRRGTSTGVVVELRPEQGVYEGVPYQYRQVSPRGNHIALVDHPRAGTRIRLDGNQESDTPGTAAAAAPEREARPMVKVTLDGISYDAAPEVANALTKAQAANAEFLARIDQAAATHKAAVDKLTAERDAYRDKVGALEARDIRAAVRARVALDSAARSLLPPAEHVRLDGMEDADIRRAVVAAVWPSLKLDDKSADYIATRFDIALEERGQKRAEDQRHEDALAAQRAALMTRQDSTSGNPQEDAARKASERIGSAWKPPRAA